MDLQCYLAFILCKELCVFLLPSYFGLGLFQCSHVITRPYVEVVYIKLNNNQWVGHVVMDSHTTQNVCLYYPERLLERLLTLPRTSAYTTQNDCLY